VKNEAINADTSHMVHSLTTCLNNSWLLVSCSVDCGHYRLTSHMVHSLTTCLNNPDCWLPILCALWAIKVRYNIFVVDHTWHVEMLILVCWFMVLYSLIDTAFAIKKNWCADVLLT
jgi:hypothetical protein